MKIADGERERSRDCRMHPALLRLTGTAFFLYSTGLVCGENCVRVFLLNMSIVRSIDIIQLHIRELYMLENAPSQRAMCMFLNRLKNVYNTGVLKQQQ